MKVRHAMTGAGLLLVVVSGTLAITAWQPAGRHPLPSPPSGESRERDATAVLIADYGVRCHGVVVDPSGVVLTVGHCSPKSGMRVRVVGREFRFRLVYTPRTMEGRYEGMTVLRLRDAPRDLPSVERRRGLPAVGERCYLAPLPGESGRPRWSRMVSTTVMDGSGARLLSTTHDTVDGDSGRPLFDESGRVIGLLSGRRTGRAESIWVPAADHSETSWRGVAPDDVVRLDSE